VVKDWDAGIVHWALTPPISRCSAGTGEACARHARKTVRIVVLSNMVAAGFGNTGLSIITLLCGRLNTIEERDQTFELLSRMPTARILSLYIANMRTAPKALPGCSENTA
jgi:hypothetical protein